MNTFAMVCGWLFGARRRKIDFRLKDSIVVEALYKFIIYHTAQVTRRELMFTRWADYIYDTIAETDEFQRLLSLECRTITEFDIEAVAGTPILATFGGLEPYTMYLSAPKQWVDFTMVDDSGPLARLESASGARPRLVLFEHPKWGELHKVVITHNNFIKTSVYRSKKLVAAIEEICGCYDTLDEALAAWPPLRYVLPDELQIKDFSFSGVPKPLPANIDVAELTTFLTRLKLGL